MPRVTVRTATADDRELVAVATLENFNWNGPRFTMAEIDRNEQARHYYADWPGADDFGLVAQDGDGAAVGVVWLRCFPETDPGYGFVADDIPELSIWVSAEHRGRGIGSTLMREAIELARSRRIRAISLSVEDGNPAKRLYERYGFGPALNGAPGCLLLNL